MLKNNALQNKFIDLIVDNDVNVRVHLNSGIKLTGKIIAHDESSIYLYKPRADDNSSKSSEPSHQIVYKNSISTVLIDGVKDLDMDDEVIFAMMQDD